MDNAGRNDPCPCGSGKKYKKCHGATINQLPDAVYAKIRRLDDIATNALMDYGRKHHGEHALEEAWAQYHFDDDSQLALTGPEADPFIRWVTFNWRPEQKEKLPELYLRHKGERIDQEFSQFIRTTLEAPYSFFQALEVEAGVGANMRDVLRKREIRVMERSATKIMKPGHIMYARLVEFDGINFFMGAGSRVILPTFLERLIRVREFLEKQGPTRDGTITTENLFIHEDDLRERYFEIEDELDNRKLELRNTDGEPIVFHTLTYEVPSSVETYHALKDLEQKVTRVSDEEMLREAETEEDGESAILTLHWLRKGYKGGFGDNTTLGTLRITKSRLVVEVNSEKRSKRIQKEIAKRLGEKAVLLRTEIKSMEGAMKEAKEKPRATNVGEWSNHDRLLRESPELRELIKGKMEQHWESWLDEPIPALRGMSPRKAAKRPEGRELLESLLLDFGSRNESQKDPYLRVDIAKLRRELGLK